MYVNNVEIINIIFLFIFTDLNISFSDTSCLSKKDSEKKNYVGIVMKKLDNLLKQLNTRWDGNNYILRGVIEFKSPEKG